MLREPPIAGSSVPVSLYHQVYSVLRQQLLEGRYPADAPIPGEVQLAETFGVSRVTMRHALSRLVQDGLIVRHRGRGTFPDVRLNERHAIGAHGHDLAHGSGLLGQLVSSVDGTTITVIDADSVAAPADVARLLEIAPGAPVQKVLRTRGTAGEPLSLMTTFVPEAVVRPFTRAQLARRPMLQLLEDAGVEIASARQSLSASLADVRTAQLLSLPVGAALLAVTRVVRDADGRAVQLLRGLYRPDRYEYRMDLSREGAQDAGQSTRIWVYRNEAERSSRGDPNG